MFSDGCAQRTAPIWTFFQPEDPSQLSDVPQQVSFGEIRGPTMGWWLTYSYPSHHQQESASLKSACSALSFQGNTIVSGHIFVVRKIGWPVCVKLSPASSGWKTPKIVAAVTKFDSSWSLFRIAERQLLSELSYKAMAVPGFLINIQ